jgi:hypothetical protein
MFANVTGVEKSINIISNNSEITNRFINEMKHFIKYYETSEEFTKKINLFIQKISS